MQIFTDLSQSKRLKDAGFPQTGSYTTIWDGPMEENMGQNIARPTVGELMEELRNKGEVGNTKLAQVFVMVLTTPIGSQFDLLSALVEAYCKAGEVGK
jgi:hypothetical protein